MALDADQLRRYFNRMDRWLDRSSLAEERREQIDLEAPPEPVTARKAFGYVWPVVRRIDRTARLKLISGSENLHPSGTTSRWAFLFDLPKRRAKAALDWVLPWDEDSDAYGSPRIEGVIRPFPAPGSLLHRMIDEGRVLYRQLNGPWRDEMNRTPVLPNSFKDSDAVIRECTERGLDLGRDETTLVAKGVSAAELVWEAQTRHETYQTSFR